jgi:transitional endoplasmic reticulum ATPase
MVADRTEGWSAAELSAIWSEASLIAASGGRSAIRDEDYIGGFERVADQRNRTTLPPQGN